MSTETGAEKRRLSRSSSENEGAIETEPKEVKGIEESNATPNIDEQRDVQKQYPDKKDQYEGDRTATAGNEDTLVTPASNNNNVIPGDGSRQIIAVSANKNPTAFFQLARKFLMTNEMCDLSALEGAIVSAVDAAHLLERSKLASIVRIHTSYVNVEPKRRRQASQQKGEVTSATITEVSPSTSTTEDGSTFSKAESSSTTGGVTGAKNIEEPSLLSSSVSDSKKNKKVSGTQQGGTQSTTTPTNRHSASSLSGSGSRELRRARILVTVKRTESYKRWLEENPTQRQAIMAGTAAVTAEDIVVGGSSSNNPDVPTTMKQSSISSKK